MPGSSSRAWQSRWTIVAVLAVAAILRVWRISEWSLWEDEMTSIYFAHNPERTFPKSFPIFFFILTGISRVTTIDELSGRLLAAFFGVLSIGLTFVFCRKFLDRSVALVAVALLTINLGHLFWSQSIRYYTLVLVFLLLSIYWFLEGFEEGKYHALLLSLLAFTLAMLTHFSALLLAPVFVAYLALMVLQKKSSGAYCAKGYAVFLLPLAAILFFFIRSILQMQRMVVAESDIFARDPLHLLVALSAYFGAPIIALAVLGAFWGRSAKRDVMLFLVIASVVPVVELLVIIIGTNVLTTWYYAFIALIPVVTLASIGLISLAQRGHRAMALVTLDRVRASTTPPLRSRISPPCTAIGLAGKRARCTCSRQRTSKCLPTARCTHQFPGSSPITSD